MKSCHTTYRADGVYNPAVVTFSLWILSRQDDSALSRELVRRQISTEPFQRTTFGATSTSGYEKIEFENALTGRGGVIYTVTVTCGHRETLRSHLGGLLSMACLE